MPGGSAACRPKLVRCVDLPKCIRGAGAERGLTSWPLCAPWCADRRGMAPPSSQSRSPGHRLPLAVAVGGPALSKAATSQSLWHHVGIGRKESERDLTFWAGGVGRAGACRGGAVLTPFGSSGPLIRAGDGQGWLRFTGAHVAAGGGGVRLTAEGKPPGAATVPCEDPPHLWLRVYPEPGGHGPVIGAAVGSGKHTQAVSLIKRLSPWDAQ